MTTPGPWDLAPHEDGKQDIVFGADKTTIAECYWPADARLIAAAPDLLAACKSIQGNVKILAETGYITDEDLLKFREAIARAEGKESA